MAKKKSVVIKSIWNNGNVSTTIIEARGQTSLDWGWPRGISSEEKVLLIIFSFESRPTRRFSLEMWQALM
jgi:hypothetical protein